MPGEVLPQPSPDMFSVLRTCPSCFRLFALVAGEVADASKPQVFRCRHCDTETTRPERTPLRFV